MSLDAPFIPSDPYGPRRYPTALADPKGMGSPAFARPPFAGWFNRVVASILDTLVYIAPCLLGDAIMLATAAPSVDALGQATTTPTPVGSAALTVGVLLTVAVGIWNRYVRQGRTGQSLGKQALGLRLLSVTTGRPIGAGRAFGREVAHLFDGVLYLGYLWPLWDAQKQTFADKLVGSVVIRSR